MTIEQLIEQLLEVDDKTKEVDLGIFRNDNVLMTAEVFIMNSRLVECDECDGTGVIEGETITSRFSTSDMQYFPDIVDNTTDCEKCKGEGKVLTSTDDVEEECLLLGETIIE